MPERSSEVLIEALRTHSVEGYPVIVPIFGPAHIVSQRGTSPVGTYNLDTKTRSFGSPMPFYRVSIDHPMPYSEYATAKGISKEPISPEEWSDLQEKALKPGGKAPLIGDEAQRRVDAGESVSRYEAEYEAMYDGEQLDGDGRVAFTSVYAQQVTMPADKLKKGMLVEFYGVNVTALTEKGLPTGVFLGRFLGYAKGKSVALLELFSPVPFSQMKGVVTKENLSEIKKGFYSEYTYTLGYGLAHGWEDEHAKGNVEEPLPPGDISEDEREYILKDMLPLSEVERFCNKVYPNFKEDFPKAAPCVWHSFIMYILPITISTGFFRPLPENVVGEDFVLTI